MGVNARTKSKCLLSPLVTQLEAAIDMLREGDKLVVTKLDRLARSVSHMGDLLEQIEAKGAGLVILSMGNERVDTSTATGKLVLNMMVSVAQFEREMMKERQVEGIKRAQAEGKYKGRVPKAMNQADKVKALVAAGVDRDEDTGATRDVEGELLSVLEGSLTEIQIASLMASRLWVNTKNAS